MNGQKNYDDVWIEENSEDSFERYLEKARRLYILSRVAIYKPKMIMEIGPGLNPIFPYIKYEDFEGSLIVEPSCQFCETIWNTCDHENILEIENCTIEDLPISPYDAYDMIVISSVLHEVEDPLKFLSNVRDHCSDDTIVHINVPNAESFHRLLGKEMGILDSVFDHSELGNKLQRKSEFSRRSLIKLMWDTGFRVINCGTILFKPFPSSIMNKIITDEMFKGLLKMCTHNKLCSMGAELYINVKIL